jgi:hypothetical protein
MSLDISHILRDWPHRDGRVTVRKITSDNGRELIQLRLDMGLLQMELLGRPDGQKPHGRESLLDYHERQLTAWRDEKGSDEGFSLNEDDCAQLRAEGVMYYHRYLAQFVLGDFASVVGDSGRNLRMFDFCQRYAAERSDRFACEQYRPYVLMMRARGQAHLELDRNASKAALAAVTEGIALIEAFYRDLGQEELIDGSGEISLLRVMAKDIETKIPVDPVQRLREKLAAAVAEERYEEAAVLHRRLQAAEPRPAEDKPR